MAYLAHPNRATAATTTMTVMLERFDLVDAADRRAQTYLGGAGPRSPNQSPAHQRLDQ